eukprot:12466152-Ditylum_brightwellii.AAC.1
MGKVLYFLGIKFQWKDLADVHLAAHLSQLVFTEQLIQQAGLATESSRSKPALFQPGHPIDNIQQVDLPTTDQAQFTTRMWLLVGSLLWLSQGTRLDL